MKAKTETPEQELLANLRSMRAKRGFNQHELAKHLKISQQSYSHLETGRNSMGIDILFKLPAILNCSIADLLPHSVLVDVDRRGMKDFHLDEVNEIWHELDGHSREQDHILETARLDVQNVRAGRLRVLPSSRKSETDTTPPALLT